MNVAGIFPEDETRFRLLFEQAPDGIVFMPVGGDRLTVNESFAAMHGYTVQEMEGMRLSSLDTPETAALAPERLRRLAAGEKLIFEVEHYHRNGHSFPLSVSCNVIRIDGKPYFLGFHQDITERRRTESLLKLSEAKYRALVESTDTGFLILDGSGRVTDANPEYVRLTGHEALGDILGRTVIEWTAEHHKAKNAEAVARCARDGFIRNLDIDYADGSGRVIPVEINATVIGSGESLRIVSLCRDITERRRAEDALHESEEKYRRLVETSADWVWAIDLEGNHTFSNNAVHELLGYRADEILGASAYPMIHKDDGPPVKNMVRECIENKSGWRNVSIRWLHRDGSLRSFESTAAPVLDNEGRVTGFSGIDRDVTERRAAEEKIKMLLEEKELLLKEVHHRIKNNMNTVTGLMGLQSEVLTEPSARGAINDTIGRVNSMMLLYDKLYRSDNFRELSFGEYTAPLVGEIIGYFPNCGTVRTEINIDDFMIDSTKLSQVGIIINELVTNAMKYAFAGRESGLIKVFASARNGGVTVSVEDDGVGMPCPDDAGGAVQKGFGLRLVDMMTLQLCGRIRIERAPGTKFILEFNL